MPEYLCCYDYGMGGLWFYIQAADPDEVVARYPVLKVMEPRPAWLTAEREKELRPWKVGDPVAEDWLTKYGMRS